jgi:hypothetical protein
VIELTKKEKNNAAMESTHSIGAHSCFSCIKPQNPNLKDAICEVCDRIFKSDKDVYICPDCQNKY